MTGNLVKRRFCGAHARTTGQPCRKPPLKDRTRCRLHGGASTGRPPIHGRYTKAALAERREAAAVVRRGRRLMRNIEACLDGKLDFDQVLDGVAES